MHTLEETSQAFTAWRSTNLNKGSQIPENLWQMVKELLPHYKKSQICKELHISGSRFNKRLQLSSSIESQSQSKNNGFAEAALPHLSPMDLCELRLQGTRKTLCLKIKTQQLPFLLPLLEHYL